MRKAVLDRIIESMYRFGLGDLEKQVLEFLWEKEEGASLKAIWQYFEKSKNLAYTTVATILQRLASKGLVEKEKGVYKAKYSKKDVSAGLLKRFLEGFFESFGEVAYSSFIEGIEKLDRRKRKKLLEKLELLSLNEN